MNSIEPTIADLVDAFTELVRDRGADPAEVDRRAGYFADELNALTAKHIGSVYVAHPDYAAA